MWCANGLQPQYAEQPLEPLLFLVLFCSPLYFSAEVVKPTATPSLLFRKQRRRRPTSATIQHQHHRVARVLPVPSSAGRMLRSLLFVPSVAGRSLRSSGFRLMRGAGAVAPVGGRFALAAERQYERQRRVHLANSTGSLFMGRRAAPTGSDCDPAALAAKAKRAERVPATEAKQRNRIRRPVSRVL